MKIRFKLVTLILLGAIASAAAVRSAIAKNPYGMEPVEVNAGRTSIDLDFTNTPATVSFQFKKNWTPARMLFGASLSIVGPDHVGLKAEDFEGSSSNILVEPLSKSQNEIDVPKTISSEDIRGYQAKKLADVGKMGGSIVKFINPQVLYLGNATAGRSIAHRYGVDYEVNQDEFTDYSYRVYCKKQFFMIYMHFSSANLKKDFPDAQSIVGSFACE